MKRKSFQGRKNNLMTLTHVGATKATCYNPTQNMQQKGRVYTGLGWENDNLWYHQTNAYDRDTFIFRRVFSFPEDEVTNVLEMHFFFCERNENCIFLFMNEQNDISVSGIFKKVKWYF